MRRGGFSLMEPVVCMILLVILLPTAVPLYDRYLSDVKEESLKQRLREMRRALSVFRVENGRYPNWLYDSFGNNVDFLDNQKSELVQGVHDGAGTYPVKRRIYLPEIPVDPVSEKRDWELVLSANENAAQQQSAGALRIATASTQRSSWKVDSGGRWTAPPQIINPFTPRPTSSTGVGDLRSRAAGYTDL